MVKERGYLSYLLRLWRAGPGATGARADAMRTQGEGWRASLEEIPTGARHAFADLDALCAYLRAQTASRALTDDTDPPDGGSPAPGERPADGDGQPA
jgi:hypothetical protein